VRYARAFGAFWYDFLVGDRPELFIGVVAILVLVRAVTGMGLPAQLAALLMPGAVCLLLAVSLARAVRRRPS
jgi:hypothetical protein